MTDVRRQTTGIPDANVQVTARGGGFGGGFTRVSVEVRGDDLATLQAIARQVNTVMSNTPGTTGVRAGSIAGIPEVRATLDRRKMSEFGLSSTQVSSTLRAVVTGSTITQLRRENQDQIDITLYGPTMEKLDLNALASIPIASTSGQIVRLGQIATLDRGTSPAQISRQDKQRVVSVSGGVADRPVGDVVRDLKENLNAIAVPEGYSLRVTGTVQQLDQAFAALTQALTLSILLIYMLLVALYESWLDPLAIMFSLPVALVGAFGALALTGNTFNIFSMIGMIMLLGLVAKNAILLVDFTKTLRGRGLARYEALVDAGGTRLRPILMTTATIVAAMIPLALKLEAGAESRAPMAVVVIGGVISSTLLTLVIVPVVYSYLDDLRNLLQRSRRKAPAARLAAETEVVVGTGGGGS
jgi:HAE1 family hydrophobic/amphiphilic exporter-1